MNDKTTHRISTLLSILMHIGIVAALYFLNVNFDYGEPDYVEIGFGSIGEFSSSGAPGAGFEGDNVSNDTEKEESEKKEEETLEDVALPESRHESVNESLESTDKTKTKETKIPPPKNDKQNENRPTNTESVKGNKLQGSGSFGFDIDWGGKGMRKLITNPPTLPKYPPGVNKEVDIRLRFSILPDGTIGSVFPLTKGDTRLENAAIQALRQWRFEPLSSSQRKVVQTAVIVFPYRLR